MAKTAIAKVPSEVVTPKRQRAINLQSYLQRWIPYWGHPGWLAAERWRAFVRNQPLAGICRDTLISNLKNMEWDIVPKHPDDVGNRNIQKAIDYYKDLFFQIEGSFDTYLDLMGQDMYDLPFGAMCEVVREEDDPEGHVLALHHVDGATLFPTGDQHFPVQQRVPELPGAIVNFPEYAMERMMISPRPEIRRKGWGMAPPEKAYLAVEMLFRGDRYYANLLLDTPEAGILDLMDMDEETADQWIEGWKSLFQGIDGFKVPILHSHEKAAQWIPLNRPPIDMMYDNVTAKYAQLLAAAYGLRLSDIGLEQQKGEKTLAGVIRGERQSRRSGYATGKTNFENHFDKILPQQIKFVWIDVDEESKLMKSKTLVSYGTALSSLVTGKMITQQEARQELVAQGLLETEIDIEELPEELQIPEEPMAPGVEPEYPFGKPVPPEEEVPPTQGGRGGPTPKMTWRQEPGDAQKRPHEWESIELKNMMAQIVKPHMDAINQRAESPRIRRLIKVATRAMVPSVAKTFEVITDDQIEDFWLPEMCAMDFNLPSEMESLILRQGINDIHEELDKHLEDDPWWQTLSDLDKTQILEIFVLAYERGMETIALDAVRALYEEGLWARPNLVGYEFNVVNKTVMRELEAKAADLVTHVNRGTKTFIKRIITSGVRQGLAAPQIAQALREGVAAETLLRWDEYMGSVEELVHDGLIEMSKSRSISIVNTEINRAENAGKYGELVYSGLNQKRWVHLGERGVTAKGNPCPCPVCAGNEELGFVAANFVFRTVFKTGGVDGLGGEHHPPAHPQVCHCTIFFDENELIDLVGRGEYKIWTGK